MSAKFKPGDRVVVSSKRFPLESGKAGTVLYKGDEPADYYTRDIHVRLDPHEDVDEENNYDYDEEDLIMKEIWDSPLAKALREDENV